MRHINIGHMDTIKNLYFGGIIHAVILNGEVNR